MAPVQAPPAADGGLLVNVLDDFSSLSTPISQQNSQDLTPGAEEGFMKFLTKNNGVLFENDILQIGVKSEYKKNLGIKYILCMMCVNMTHGCIYNRPNRCILW